MTQATPATAARQKRRTQLLRTPGVTTIRRPLPDGSWFDLAYTRTGPEGGIPVLVFPGGPGIASVLPYQRLRAKAAARGLRLVMMEHRGVGLSRTNVDGTDLPRAALTITDVIDDALAILDAEGIDRAVVYGTSYGSYLAQGFGVRHPGRVAGMILDSAMLGARFGASASEALRSLYWTGTPATAPQADAVRELVQSGALDPDTAGFPIQVLHEVGGADLVGRALALLQHGKGRRFWRWLHSLGAGEVMTVRPFAVEFDLVGEIAFRELDFAPPTRGEPLETSSAFSEAASHFSPFHREPFDLPTQVRAFTWPTVVISGDRDIRTPRVTAAEIVSRVPGAALLPVRDHGHSALDTHPSLALDVMHAVTTSLGEEHSRTMQLPADPQGTRNLMRTIIGARLTFATHAPRAWS